METLATRPDLLDAALRIGDIGFEFLQHDEIGTLTRAARLARRWPEHFLVLLDGGEPVARAVGVPVAFPAPGREELPDTGWDGAILWAAEDALDGRRPTALAALDVQVALGRRGEGIAAEALRVLEESARGLSRLVVPVRPTTKALEPHVPMAEFVARSAHRTTAFGPFVHRRRCAGARARLGGARLRRVRRAQRVGGVLARRRPDPVPLQCGAQQ
ncbi:hypothetical protein SAMN05421835_112209 [Amycolatopsis sacchari]|uniref:Uncharacterized protein n=1 Tax=Amycolatopsis sacchari TaxID=115433 RepID=A0A1I3WAV9_9PSEU|nr:hypothetical protein SAMN05421835_112209 [Amycolatopsis sacchari]